MRERRLIFLAGIPGTGKSHFGTWLRENHGFMYVELENEASRRSTGVFDSWNHFNDTRDTAPLFREIRRGGSDVILEWGFPVHCLSMVEMLISSGAEPWWFDGDVEAARHQFARRNTSPVVNFDAQAVQIQTQWSKIAPVFGRNIIRVLETDGTNMGCERIWARMNEHAA